MIKIDAIDLEWLAINIAGVSATEVHYLSARGCDACGTFGMTLDEMDHCEDCAPDLALI